MNAALRKILDSQIWGEINDKMGKVFWGGALYFQYSLYFIYRNADFCVEPHTEALQPKKAKRKLSS